MKRKETEKEENFVSLLHLPEINTEKDVPELLEDLVDDTLFKKFGSSILFYGEEKDCLITSHTKYPEEFPLYIKVGLKIINKLIQTPGTAFHKLHQFVEVYKSIHGHELMGSSPFNPYERKHLIAQSQNNKPFLILIRFQNENDMIPFIPGSNRLNPDFIKTQLSNVLRHYRYFLERFDFFYSDYFREFDDKHVWDLPQYIIDFLNEEWSWTISDYLENEINEIIQSTITEYQVEREKSKRLIYDEITRLFSNELEELRNFVVKNQDWLDSLVTRKWKRVHGELEKDIALEEYFTMLTMEGSLPNDVIGVAASMAEKVFTKAPIIYSANKVLNILANVDGSLKLFAGIALKNKYKYVDCLNFTKDVITKGPVFHGILGSFMEDIMELKRIYAKIFRTFDSGKFTIKQLNGEINFGNYQKGYKGDIPRDDFSTNDSEVYQMVVSDKKTKQHDEFLRDQLNHLLFKIAEKYNHEIYSKPQETADLVAKFNATPAISGKMRISIKNTKCNVCKEPILVGEKYKKVKVPSKGVHIRQCMTH
jgi:hypothetical protein